MASSSLNSWDISKEIFKLATPILLGQVGIFAMILIDTLMVSVLGEVAIAGVGLGSLLFFSFFAILVGVLSALDPLISTATGRKDIKGANTFLGAGLTIALVLSLLSFFGLRLLSSSLVSLGVQAPIAEATQQYISSLSFCIFSYTFFVVFRQTLAGLKDVHMSTLILLMGLGINIFLNNSFIPIFGIFGVGLATTFTRTLMCAAIFIYFRKQHKKKPSLYPWTFFSTDKKIIIRFLNIGLPAGIQALIRSLSFFLIGLWMSSLSASAMAAHTICTNIGSFLYMIPLGASGATAVLVGQALGKKQFQFCKTYTQVSIVLMTLIMSGLSLLLILFRISILESFSSDQEVLHIGSSLLLLLSVFQILDAAQTVATGALRGLSQTQTPFMANTFSWGVGLFLSYFLSLRLGFLGLWWGLLGAIGILSGMILFLTYIYFKQQHRVWLIEPAWEGA